MPYRPRRFDPHALALPTILAATLVAAPLLRAGGRLVIGVVAAARGASLDGVQLLDDQDAVVVGDRLATDSGGSALVRISARAQLRLSGSTSVRFKSSDGRVVVEMSSGMALAQGLRNETPVVEIPAYRIEPAGSERTAYLVAMLADRKTAVFARAGQVSVTGIVSGEHRVINQGEVAEIIADPGGVPGQEKEEGQPAPGKQAGQESGPQPAQTSTPPKAKSTSHTGIIILAGGAAAAAGAAAALAGGGGGGSGGGSSSPSRP